MFWRYLTATFSEKVDGRWRPSIVSCRFSKLPTDYSNNLDESYKRLAGYLY